MTRAHSDLLAEKDRLFAVISEAMAALKLLREECPHEVTKRGNFGFERPPNIYECDICTACGIDRGNWTQMKFVAAPWEHDEGEDEP